ncbi:uncharacterized protein [Misgurnus anguillicaudatus]|uniref:uncharacterized protein n=1 Tax=Misgurnus anguillicaudatus TaxID=75329 RepID=UPI003CCF660D
MSFLWLALLLGSAILAEEQYFPQSSAKTWDEARDHCQTCFKDLATITCRNIHLILQNINSEYWIGLRRRFNGSKAWSRWSNGDHVTYQNWYPGHPVQNEVTCPSTPTSTTPVTDLTSTPENNSTSTCPVNDSSSTTPVNNSTSTTPVNNSTSTTPVNISTSSTPVNNSTSTIPVNNSTSTFPVNDSTGTTPLNNSTSSTPVTDSTSSTPVTDSTSVIRVTDSTSTTLVTDSTSTIPVNNSTSTTPVNNSTSTTPVNNSTSTTPVNNSTSTTPVNISTSTIPVNNSTSTITVNNSTSTTPVNNSTSTIPVNHLTSTTPVNHSTSTTPVNHSTSTTPVNNSTSTTPISSSTSKISSTEDQCSLLTQMLNCLNMTYFINTIVTMVSTTPHSLYQTLLPVSMPSSTQRICDDNGDTIEYIEDACVALLSNGMWEERFCNINLSYICYEERFMGEIHISNETETGVNLSWSQAPGDITHYRVEVTADQNETFKKILNETNLSTQLLDLKKGTQYDVQVIPVKCGRDLNPLNISFFTSK